MSYPPAIVITYQLGEQMNLTHTRTPSISVFGLEFVPFQEWATKYRRRIVIDLGEHSFAFEWKKVK